jgi:hypothetical protein
MIIFLYSLKPYDIWSVLMAHLLLHDFLHLFMYDAGNTVCLTVVRARIIFRMKMHPAKRAQAQVTGNVP